jgi:hypothetical protein
MRLMSDTSNQSDDRPQLRRSGFGAGPWVLLAVILVIAGAALIWANHRSGTGSPEVAGVQSNTPSAPPPAAVDDTARQGVADLQQTIKDLRAARQGAADQLSELQRQLAAERGERQLLSQQLGALSARVDRLTAPNAEVPSPAPPSARKKR